MGKLADDSMMPVYKVPVAAQYQIIPGCFACGWQMLRTGVTFDKDDPKKAIYHYKCPHCGREEESEICYPYTRYVLDPAKAERIDDPIAFYNGGASVDTIAEDQPYKIECKKLSEITE